MEISALYRILKKTKTPKRVKVKENYSVAHRISSELEQKVILNYLIGWTQYRIVGEMKVSNNTLYRILKRNNIESRGREIYGTNKGCCPTKETREKMSKSAKNKPRSKDALGRFIKGNK